MPRSRRYPVTELPGTLQRSCREARETFLSALDDAVRAHGAGDQAHRIAYLALKQKFEKRGRSLDCQGQSRGLRRGRESRLASGPQEEQRLADPAAGIVTHVLSRRRLPHVGTPPAGSGRALSNRPVPGLRASAGEARPLRAPVPQAVRQHSLEAQRAAGRGKRRAQRVAVRGFCDGSVVWLQSCPANLATVTIDRTGNGAGRGVRAELLRRQQQGHGGEAARPRAPRVLLRQRPAVRRGRPALRAQRAARGHRYGGGCVSAWPHICLRSSSFLGSPRTGPRRMPGGRTRRGRPGPARRTIPRRASRRRGRGCRVTAAGRGHQARPAPVPPERRSALCGQ
jgi:hypothetical protein